MRHELVADGFRRDIERVDQRQAAAEQCRQRARHLRRRELSRDRAESRQTEDEVIELRPLAGAPDPGEPDDDGDDEQRQDQRVLRPHEAGNAQDDFRDEWQLGAERAVEIREGRHDPDHDDRYQHQGQRNQDCGIDERGQCLALHCLDDLRVLDEPPQHGVEVAAALAGQQRGGVDAREDIAVRRRRHPTRPSPTRTFSCTSSSTRRKVGDVTRLRSRSRDWTSGMPARNRVASSWLKTRNSWVLMASALGQVERHPGDGVLGLKRKDEQALLLQLVTQPGFGLGNIDALRRFRRWAKRGDSEIPWNWL